MADLGAGNGYLTLPIAEQTNDTVYAVDVEPKMLELLKERASQAKLHNIQYIQSDLEEIKLDDQSVNKAIMAFVLHEIPNKKKAVDECRRIIKRQGRLVLLEWEAVESDQGPPLHHRISSSTLKKFISERGLDAKIIPLNREVYAASIDFK